MAPNISCSYHYLGSHPRGTKIERIEKMSTYPKKALSNSKAPQPIDLAYYNLHTTVCTSRYHLNGGLLLGLDDDNEDYENYEDRGEKSLRLHTLLYNIYIIIESSRPFTCLIIDITYIQTYRLNHALYCIFFF